MYETAILIGIWSTVARHYVRLFSECWCWGLPPRLSLEAPGKIHEVIGGLLRGLPFPWRRFLVHDVRKCVRLRVVCKC